MYEHDMSKLFGKKTCSGGCRLGREEKPMRFDKKVILLSVAATVVLGIISVVVAYGGTVLFMVQSSGWEFAAAVLVFVIPFLGWDKGKQQKPKPERYKLLG